jgi:cytochrome P450
MVRRNLQQSEVRLAQWLTEATEGDLWILVKLLRQEIAQRIEDADSVGDGPYVNALCEEARRWFTPSSVW